MFAIALVASTNSFADPSPTTRVPDKVRLEQVKALCRFYEKAYVSDVTKLAYGRRLDGPKGAAALESLESVKQGMVGGKVNPMGYGSGIEDTAYHNGLLLYALCDAEEATGDPLFAEIARRAFQGLQRIGSTSPNAGFVVRGPHPLDNQSYYADSSLDQHSLFVCGLWRYQRSRIASPEEKVAARKMIDQVLRRLEKNNWSILRDDNVTPAWEGGSLRTMNSKFSLLLLVLVGAAKDVTGDAHWGEVYDKFSAENEGARWAALARPEAFEPGRYTMFMNQHIVRGETLRHIEKDEGRRAVLRARTTRMAEDMLTQPYFVAWRPLEWLGVWTLEEDENRTLAGRYLAPLDLKLDSPLTSLQLFKRYSPTLHPPKGIGRSAGYGAITLTTPAMVCQIALLSEKQELIEQVQPAVGDLYTKVDFENLNSGWSTNYALLAGLWSLAHASR